jgi:hypothetical protein
VILALDLNCWIREGVQRAKNIQVFVIASRVKCIYWDEE